MDRWMESGLAHGGEAAMSCPTWRAVCGKTGHSRSRWRCINIRLALQTASTIGVVGGRYELLLRLYHEDGAAGVDLPCGMAVVSGIVTNTRPMAKIPRWGK
jgi:hypothetical protein